MIVKIIVCFIIPLLFFSFILNKEHRLITSFLGLGTLACYGAYILNNWLMANTNCTYFFLTSTLAPIIEESLKFFPILLASLFLKKYQEYLLPIGFAIGIGFAITENMYMLMESTTTASIQWLILRGTGAGLMHAMSASIIALGVLKTKQYPKLSFVGIVASMFLAMIYHGFYNCLVNSDGVLRYIGITLPIITYAVIFVIYKKDVFKELLTSEEK